MMNIKKLEREQHLCWLTMGNVGSQKLWLKNCAKDAALKHDYDLAEYYREEYEKAVKYGEEVKNRFYELEDLITSLKSEG